MSRRARARANARPWEQMDHIHLPAYIPDQEEDDTEPLYLANGDRIDTRSAWQMPGQQEQPR